MYFTADTHFNHKNILKYCPDTRGGCKTIEEMNDRIVDEWNSRIGKGDLVYHLGDVAFGPPKAARKYVEALNGDKILIRGNHDTSQYLKVFGDLFMDIKDYARVKTFYKDKRYEFILFHYPIKEWDKCHHGTIQLYGHIHQRAGVVEGRSINVGVDQHPDMAPFSAAQLIEMALDMPIIKHHENENNELHPSAGEQSVSVQAKG